MKRPKEFAELILASLSDGIVIVDPACRVVMLNPAMEEMTGISSRRVVGKPLATLLPKASLIPTRVVATLNTGHPFFAPEAEWQQGDGKPFPTSVSISSLMDRAGKHLGAVLVVKDLRRIKELEESQRPGERLNTFGVLAAAMAHEIKNPLLGIRGAAQLLRDELPTDGARQYTDVIIREADRLNALMEDMLDFARPHSLQRTPVNLHQVLDTVIALERRAYELHGMQIKQLYDPSLPDLWADRNRLIQVFLNLVRNAREAMSRGGTLIIATKHAGEPVRIGPGGGPMLLVELTDNGCGIPPEVQQNLFTPFFTTKAKGSGLGLAISHRIVEEHGGRFIIRSVVGQGTTVRVYLPLSLGVTGGSLKEEAAWPRRGS